MYFTATSSYDEGWSRPSDLMFETAGLQIGKQVLMGCAKIGRLPR
jgi:hypothetical protein